MDPKIKGTHSLLP